MKNKIAIIILSMFVGSFFTGCKNSNENKQNSNARVLNEDNSTEIIITDKLCFKNEYPFQDNPSIKDVLELTLNIEGKNVTGTYNWLPAEKDERKGSLDGVIEDKRITAQYRFLQEGIEDSTKLIILINNQKAEVSGGAPELGLNASISSVDCLNQ